MDPEVLSGAAEWLAELESAVTLLNASAEVQREWLEREFAGHEGVVVDELALQLDDRWMEGKIVYASSLSDRTRESVQELDDALAAMSGTNHADLWTLASLASAREWSNIRALAGVALDHLRNRRR